MKLHFTRFRESLRLRRRFDEKVRKAQPVVVEEGLGPGSHDGLDLAVDGGTVLEVVAQNRSAVRGVMNGVVVRPKNLEEMLDLSRLEESIHGEVTILLDPRLEPC